MSTLSLILLWGLAAQSQEHGAYVQPSFQSDPLIWASQQRPPVMNGNICFAIRSYVFKRQDGNAPVLVSTSTCTPASAVRHEQVTNPPNARLIPQ